MALNTFTRLTAASLVALTSTLGWSAEATFDMNKAHAYTGLGAHLWIGEESSAQKSAPVQELLRDLNARYVRIAVRPRLDEGSLPNNPSVQDVLRAIRAQDDAQMRSRVAALRDDLKALGVAAHLIFFKAPEHWARVENKPAGKKSRSRYMQNDRIDDYATLVVAQMAYVAQLGLLPEAVELVNEPNGAWGTKFEPDGYATLVKTARRLMNENGLAQVKIEGPGVSLKAFDAYIGALKRADAVRDVGIISGHVYETAGDVRSGRDKGRGSMLGRGTFGPIVVTEFGVHRGTQSATARGETVDDVRKPLAALKSTALATELLAQGAGGVIYWQIRDPRNAPAEHGMIDDDGRRRPVADAFVAMFGKLPKSGQVNGTQYPMSGDLYAALMQSSGRSYLMLTNVGSTTQELTARIQGGNGSCNSVDAVSSWSAGGGRDAVRATAQHCTVKVTVAPGSVGTVILK